MRTPRTLSPYMLVQEFLRDEPWKLLCAVIMLNQTSARQMWRILPDFFDRYPDPAELIIASEDEVKGAIKSLGFMNRRYERLFGMSVDFVTNVPVIPREGMRRGMYGIGKYGQDSYRIFCEGVLVEDVTDKELRNYVRWARSQGGLSS